MSSGQSIDARRLGWRGKQGAVNTLTLLAILVPMGLLAVGIAVGFGVEPGGGSGGGGTVYQQVEGESYLQAGYVHTGRVFATEPSHRGLSFGVSERAGFTAVQIPGTVTITGYEPGSYRLMLDGSARMDVVYRPTPDTVARTLELALEIPFEPSRLRVLTLPEEGGAREPVLVNTVSGGRPELIIRAVNKLTRGRHRVGVDTSGHLWVDLDPEQSIVDARTGAAIAPATEDFRFLGRLSGEPVAGQGNVCEGDNCQVHFHTREHELIAPVDGELGCPGSPRVLDAGEYRLRFWAQGGPHVALAIDCEPTPVSRGDVIGPRGGYVVTVNGPNGAGSLVLDRDNALWAGDFAPSVGCPCREAYYENHPR